ncbi:MAG TPA: DUF3137 domain-containing protein [Allosphingosinicella sp.]|nr:DUF3137 domain-containing protein [Allosphingosinicella sp.]
MTELTASDFPALCSDPAVQERINSFETERSEAARKFWTRGAIGTALAIGAVVTLTMSGWDVAAWIVFALFLVGAIWGALSPLLAAKEAMKNPVLEAVAKRAGMEYLPNGFEPPVFGSAYRLLFGSGFSSATYTDLFNGADEEGRGFAFYEANLQRRSGKNTHTVFSGQIYAIQRRPGHSGHTVIVPDRKIFNFWKPASDMVRVKIPGDDAFERRFEVYSTAEMEARQLLFDTALRQRLLELRKGGRVYVYLDPEEALVAVSGKDRFEPGNMLRRVPGTERVRTMFEDVCAALGLLRELKAKLS